MSIQTAEASRLYLLLFVLANAGCAVGGVAGGAAGGAPQALGMSTGRNEPSTINWPDTSWWVGIRKGGKPCDEHQFSVYPGVADVVRQSINSTPEGVNVYIYFPNLKRIRPIGTTP